MPFLKRIYICVYKKLDQMLAFFMDIAIAEVEENDCEMNWKIEIVDKLLLLLFFSSMLLGHFYEIQNRIEHPKTSQ